MPYLYLVVVFALLLAGMALGAIVTLLAVRAIQESSSSMQQFSKDVASIAMENLVASEREASRDRALSEVTRTLTALDLTVGQMFHQLRSMTSDGGIRGQHTRHLQHGEGAPGSPSQRVSRETQGKLPPEGFPADDEETETPRGSTPAAEATRAAAFAART
jgi:hypothetical protein